MTKAPVTATICTLGCKVNQYDSDTMAAILKEGGFLVKEGVVPAEVYIINTCAVTAEAERKSRQIVGKILKVNSQADIYVCGCASQYNVEQFARDGVKFVSGTSGKSELARDLIAKYFQGADQFNIAFKRDISMIKEYEESLFPFTARTRHFIKIQDGCNNFCSYCIVPYLRGRSRSRSLASVLDEVRANESTAKEVVLTGINLSAYGKDLGTSLTELIRALKDSPLRIRLGSLEAGVINEPFLEALAGLKKFCPHFHLSLQSGDDGVLKAMNRKYLTAEYASKVELIKKTFPNVAITTDIIVGFPTEDGKAFDRSKQFYMDMEFANVHVFPYSSREGTSAAKLPVLPPDIVSERQHAMIEVKKDLSNRYKLKQLGKATEVLFETKEGNMWCGHTPNYVKIYSPSGERNAIATVVPIALYEDGLRV